MIPKEISVDTRLRSLILNTGLPLKVFAENSNITSEQCLSWWNGKLDLPHHFDLNKLCSFIGISNIEFKEYPERIPIIAKRLFHKRFQLPEKYTFTPLSYVSTSRHILETIRIQYGRISLYNVLTELGVYASYFEDINNRISIRFFEDLLDQYNKLSHGRPDFNFLSRSIFLTVEETSLSKSFSKASSYQEAFEQIEMSIPFFDNNFEYNFSVGKTGVEIFAKPSDQLSQAMSQKNYGSKSLYEYRSQLFGNMVHLCGLKPLKMDVHSCVSRGDSFSHYSAKYSSGR